MSSVAIIDSGGANIASVVSALERLDIHPHFTKEAKNIQSADKVILPGVGAAQHGMKCLHENDLINVIQKLEQPVLGICLGMQLLFDASEEGDTTALGCINGSLRLFSNHMNLTIPHMGWNNLTALEDHPLLYGLNKESYFYFVHSYYAPVGDFTIGTTNYGCDFTSIAAKDNFMGCQFHPEKSGDAGEQILRNFLDLKL